MVRKTKKDLEHELEIKNQTNRTLAGILENTKTYIAKLEEYIEAGDLEGAQEYLDGGGMLNE